MIESKATQKYISSSPRKMRLVIDLIRDKNVEDGLNILKHLKKQASKIVYKTLNSAYNNLINKLDTGKLNAEEVIITRVFVDGGPVLKRMLPAPQGRAFRIRKRSAHLTIQVGYEQPEKEQINQKQN